MKSGRRCTINQSINLIAACSPARLHICSLLACRPQTAAPASDRTLTPLALRPLTPPAPCSERPAHHQLRRRIRKGQLGVPTLQRGGHARRRGPCRRAAPLVRGVLVHWHAVRGVLRAFSVRLTGRVRGRRCNDGPHRSPMPTGTPPTRKPLPSPLARQRPQAFRPPASMPAGPRPPSSSSQQTPRLLCSSRSDSLKLAGRAACLAVSPA